MKNNYMAMRVQNKDDLYYDAMDALNEGEYETAEDMLLKAKKIDPEYVQTYIGLVSAYGRPKDRKKAIENTKTAYEKTIKAFPKWPRRMEWGFLENRAYLRAIQYRADLYWDDKDYINTEKLFRLLLKLNPNDNQGVRYELAAMLAGINGRELNKMFDEGNEKQNWDKLERLVKVQNDKYKFWKEPRG
ncbi:MAG: hypothetical protein WCW14_04285 [Candidatus Paceibacterota bacterium]|jgi:tetratricopeptide (TPR) repeat protein